MHLLVRLASLGLACLMAVSIARGQTVNYEQEVKQAVLSGYDRTSRPFPLFPAAPVVTQILVMLRSFEIEELQMTATINAWVVLPFCLRVRQVWKDHRLSWQPSDHGDTWVISLLTSQIWLPDIVLMNGVTHLEPIFVHVPLLVSSSGMVSFVGPATFRVRCRQELDSWPYDLQKCTVILSSWTQDADHHQVEPAALRDGPELVYSKDMVATDSHWRVVRAEGSLVNQTYSCCPDSIWHEVNIDLHVKRVSMLYAVSFILPCIVLAVHVLAVFWIPPESPAKVKAASIHTVALAFFLISLFWQMPPFGGGTVPKIVSFVAGTLAMSTVSMVMAVVSSNLVMRISEPPAALLTVYGGIISIVLRLGDLNGRMQSRRAPFAEDGVPAQDKQAQETVRRAEWAVIAAGMDRSVCLAQLVVFVLMGLACLS